MEETEMKKRKTRIRWGRVCVAGIILMLVLKLLASFVMTAFEKRYEELGFGESAEETGTFITKPEKLPQNQVNAKLKKMAEQLPKIKEIYDKGAVFGAFAVAGMQQSGDGRFCKKL